MSATLRILQLNSARKYVGEAAHTLGLTEALRQAGHLVVLGLRDSHGTFYAAEKRGLDPVPFHMPHRWWPPRDLPDLRKIARLVRTQNVQLIHAHRGKDHWLAMLATRLFRLRVPIVRTRHVVTPLHANRANRWLAQRTARLVAVSKAVEADVLSTGLYPRAHVIRIPGGIDARVFVCSGRRQAVRERLGLGAHAPVAVCVARFAAVKAHRVLVASWQKVRANVPDAMLLLVGAGLLQEAVQAQARELGLEHSIQFLGRRDYAEIPELLEAADVGVLPSVGSEGFSRAVLEYMAMGLPVVATRVGAVPDLIEDGIHGWVVPAEDPQALGAALSKVLAAPADQRKSWGNAGKARADASHGYVQWATAHARLYREILEG